MVYGFCIVIYFKIIYYYSKNNDKNFRGYKKGLIKRCLLFVVKV